MPSLEACALARSTKNPPPYSFHLFLQFREYGYFQRREGGGWGTLENPQNRIILILGALPSIGLMALYALTHARFRQLHSTGLKKSLRIPYV